MYQTTCTVCIRKTRSRGGTHPTLWAMLRKCPVPVVRVWNLKGRFLTRPSLCLLNGGYYVVNRLGRSLVTPQ